MQTHTHLVCKRTLNHLANMAILAKWLSVPASSKEFLDIQANYGV